MTDLRDLYQEVIIDHGRYPRNFYVLENAERHVEGVNPLCGDRLTLYLNVAGDRIKEVSFFGCGCAISTSSASLMTEAIKGMTLDEADALFQDFHHMLTGKEGITSDELITGLGKLAILAGVKQFPARVKCATLAWHTLHAAVTNATAVVSTE